jgi:hypothetical protein
MRAKTMLDNVVERAGREELGSAEDMVRDASQDFLKSLGVEET